MASAGGDVLFLCSHYFWKPAVRDWPGFTTDGVIIRPTVRVLLLDLDDCALLFRGRNPDGARFWFTPGGGADPGERAEETAHRKLFEETGLAGVTLGGEIWRRTVRGEFEGQIREFRERWFLARVPRFELNTSGFNEIERDTISQHRWWALEELRSTSDRIAPVDLAEHLDRLLRTGIPGAPIDISRS